jgi:hypothetical protein
MSGPTIEAGELARRYRLLERVASTSLDMGSPTSRALRLVNHDQDGSPGILHLLGKENSVGHERGLNSHDVEKTLGRKAAFDKDDGQNDASPG